MLLLQQAWTCNISTCPSPLPPHSKRIVCKSNTFLRKRQVYSTQSPLPFFRKHCRAGSFPSFYLLLNTGMGACTITAVLQHSGNNAVMQVKQSKHYTSCEGRKCSFNTSEVVWYWKDNTFWKIISQVLLYCILTLAMSQVAHIFLTTRIHEPQSLN